MINKDLKIGLIIKIMLITIAILIMLSTTLYIFAKANPPMPIGICGKVTINGEAVNDGYVIIRNVDTNEVINADIENNGFFVASTSGISGNLINVSFYYENKYFYNETKINTEYPTQWCNISINIETDENDEDEENKENKKPIIVFPDEIKGYTGEEIIFDASSCYDTDGYIISYEWSVYDYPPFSKVGISFKKTWYSEKNIVGILRVYDNDLASTSKSFYIIINDKNESEIENNTENNTDNIVNITLPPIANFTYDGILEYNNSIHFISTSYDQDGYITNWTWVIGGNIFYGENITYTLPYDEDDYYWLNVILTVVDNDKLINQIENVLLINKNNTIDTEKYNLKIITEKEVSIIIKNEENEILENDYGKEFEFILPKGSYKVIYAYDGKEYVNNITLNKNETISFSINKTGKTPFIEVPTFFIILIIALFIYKMRDENEK